VRIRFPFFYSADVVMGRTDKVRTETFLETFEIDVPEITGAEMPVALMSLSVFGRPEIYRHRNGRFLSEHPHPDGILAKDLVPKVGNMAARSIASILIASVDGPTETLKREIMSWYADPHFEAVRKPRGTQVKEWYSGTRAKALEKAKRYAEGIVISDGRVWFPVGEPKFGVSRAAGASVAVIANRVDYASRVNNLWGHPVLTPVFNVNSLEEVDAYCAANFDQINMAFNRAALEIRIPEAFVFDRARHAIDWAAMEALEIISSSIRDRPDAVVTQWMEARRIFERGNSNSAGWEEAVAQAVETLLPRIQSREKVSEIEAILGVWADSSISLEFDNKQKSVPAAT
jgi:hypothetical protein